MYNLQIVEDSLRQFVQELKLVRQWKFAALECQIRLNSFERRWKHGQPRSLESHLDTLVEEVVDENFPGDPSKLAKGAN